MKKEEKKLHEEVNSSAPDLKKEIKSSVDWNALARKNAKKEKKRTFFNGFLRFSAPIAACVALILALTVLIPAIGGNGGNPTPGSVIRAEAKDVYALSALSGAKLLNAERNRSVDSLLSKEAATTRPDAVKDGDIGGIKDCLAMFGSFVEGGGFTKTIAENSSTEENLAKYGYVMTLTVAGEEKYSLYYTEIATETKTEIDDDEEETEVSTTFEGLLVIDGNEYLVTGKKEIETEDDEREEEFEITTRSKDNPLDYVVITHSVEEEKNERETSYEFKVYENGKKVSEKEISFEEENGRLELKIETEDKTSKTETEYKIVSENGKLFVKYELNDVKGKITVTKTSDGYTFTYDNGYTETVTF